MIIPLLCFTCGKPIADRWVEYKDMLEFYKKQQAKGEYNDGELHRTPEARVLDELGMSRYCCRRMYLCQPEHLVEMLKNRQEIV